MFVLVSDSFATCVYIYQLKLVASTLFRWVRVAHVRITMYTTSA